METPNFIYSLPIIAVALLVAPAALAVQSDCNDEKVLSGWQALLNKYPRDHELRQLYQLRDTLCRQIESGTLPLSDASERFEEARQRLIRKWHKQNERRQTRRSVTG